MNTLQSTRNKKTVSFLSMLNIHSSMMSGKITYELNVNKDTQFVYIPSKVTETFGTELKLVHYPNVGILFSKGAKIEDVIRSIRFVLDDLENSKVKGK